MPRVLIVTAVAAERDALLAGLAGPVTVAGPAGARSAAEADPTSPAAPPDGAGRVTVAAVGVGPAAAAAGTARLLALAEAAGSPYQVVVSAGVAGGFPGRAGTGGVVLATRSIAADLGAASAEGFLPLDELGFGSTVAVPDPALTAALREALPGTVAGAVLTVSTVTGTADGTAALTTRYPDAVAEAMEGYGVACAATISGVAFAELRTISNSVGPRDRGSWRIADALAALRSTAPALAGLAAPAGPGHPARATVAR
ncbi:MAG TPA: futalosine hydrolase [Micromonosporaceae bacterium]|nr:futalosine hydrolase [Micromonosporaceae bacterium]